MFGLRKSVLIGSLAVAASAATAADFVNKTVGNIRGPDGRPCTFFTLEGVSEADPGTPGTPWFALRQASPGYEENLAILISAKLTGRPIQVTTAGVVAGGCNHVEAYVIILL
jgi:hypothetical protein